MKTTAKIISYASSMYQFRISHMKPGGGYAAALRPGPLRTIQRILLPFWLFWMSRRTCLSQGAAPHLCNLVPASLSSLNATATRNNCNFLKIIKNTL